MLLYAVNYVGGLIDYLKKRTEEVLKNAQPEAALRRKVQMNKTKTVFDGFFSVEEWDNNGPFPLLVARTSDSVAGLLYDETNDRVLLVRQQRAAMVRDDNPTGEITEMVAGRFDVALGPKSLLVKEALEEAGVEIDETDVELLNNGSPMALSAGVLTERCYLAFAVVRPEKIADGETFGCETEGESITRLWQNVDEFLDGQHEDLRVWAFAQHLARRLTERY